MGKKIIEFGWDVPSPACLRDNIRAMERRPFDGVMIRLSEDAGQGKIFDVKAWDKVGDTARKRELETLAAVPQGGRFTDNFIVLYAASSMDWFSDADWKKVTENVRFCARAAKAGGCRGVVWDPEPYGGINPWVHAKQQRAGEKTFPQYEEIVRRRGAQFVRAFAREFPEGKLLSLRWLSDFGDGSPWSGRILNEPDLVKREAMIPDMYYGLHRAFLNGVLDAAPKSLVITDGDEDAYYFTSAKEFYKSYWLIKNKAQELVAPENRAKYRAQVQVSQALYVDYVFAKLESLGDWFPKYLVQQAHELTPEQRAKWFEHNVYYALATADEYVWCYSEKMNWWKGEAIPPGLEEAIRSARQKYEAGLPLGFEIENDLALARAHAKARVDAEKK